MDIAPIHTILSQVVTLCIADRDVFSNGDCIEILSLQEHVITIKTDCVALIERSLICTHNTLVTSIGVRHSELRTISTTSQGYRVVLLYSILILECTPPVSASPTAVYLSNNVLWNETSPIQLLTRSIESVLINNGHKLLSIKQLWTLVCV